MIADEHAAFSVNFSPKLISFDVFGTLISVREGSYAAFQSILDDVGGAQRRCESFLGILGAQQHSALLGALSPIPRHCALSLSDASLILGCTATRD